jgi:hypothetical protein
LYPRPIAQTMTTPPEDSDEQTLASSDAKPERARRTAEPL